MHIKAGKYTLALTMILCGVLMLINNVYGHGMFADLWQYSPIVLMIFGLEIITLNLVFGRKDKYKVEVSVGCIILIIFVVALFLAWNNIIGFQGQFPHDLFKL